MGYMLHLITGGHTALSIIKSNAAEHDGISLKTLELIVSSCVNALTLTSVTVTFSANTNYNANSLEVLIIGKARSSR